MRVLLLPLCLALIGCGDDSGAADAASIDATVVPDAWTPTRTCTAAEAEQMIIDDGFTCTFGQCHDGDMPAGGLDLGDPGSLAALAGMPSSNCPDKVLVVPGDPDGSYFVEKLSVDPTCGGQMPSPGFPLTVEQVDCIRTAIRDLPAQ